MTFNVLFCIFSCKVMILLFFKLLVPTCVLNNELLFVFFLFLKRLLFELVIFVKIGLLFAMPKLFGISLCFEFNFIFFLLTGSLLFFFILFFINFI